MAEQEPDRGALRVSPKDGLVERTGTPVTLASGHHDLTAHIPYDPRRLQETARIVARERGDDPAEYTSEDELVFAVDLFERAWPWADFILGPNAPSTRGHQRLYCTAKAEPPADTTPPSHLARADIETGRLRGNAIVCEIDHHAGLGQLCESAGQRRNRRGEVDQLRAGAAAGDGGHLVDRR